MTTIRTPDDERCRCGKAMVQTVEKGTAWLSCPDYFVPIWKQVLLMKSGMGHRSVTADPDDWRQRVWA